MVNYKLGICNDNNVKEINFDTKELKQLKFIDKLTSEFENESQLKFYLTKKELIDKNDLDKSLEIVYKYNNEIKILPIIYKKHLKYLDISYLIYKVRSMKNSLSFLNQLANHYDYGNNNPQSVNVLDIRCYINEIKSGKIPITSLDIALDDLCRKAIYIKDKSKNSLKLNYRGLRDLGMFIYRFENIDELSSNYIVDNKNEFGKQLTLFDNSYKKNI